MFNKEYKKKIKELELELSNMKSGSNSIRNVFRSAFDHSYMEGDAKFQVLINKIPAYIGYVNADTLKYEYVNDMYAESFGIPRDKIIGSHIKDIIGEKNFEFASKYIEEVKSGKSGKYENIFYTGSGKRWTQINYSPVTDDNGSVIAIAILSYDITEHKNAESSLQKSELKYRSLIESTSDAIFCVDEKGQYQFTNQLFASTFGKVPDYFIGKSFWDIYPEEQANNNYELTQRVYNNDKSESLEVEVPLPGKTLYFLSTASPVKDETGKVVLVLTHYIDITELKNAQRALEVSSQFSSQIINCVHEGIIVYDLHLRYQLWNPFMEELSGMPASQVLGKHPGELFPFLEEAGVIENLKRTLNGEILDAVDFHFHLPESGKSGWTSDKNVPFRDVNGEIIGVIGTVYDISVRKKAEEELNNKMEELMSAYKQLEQFAFDNKELKQFAYISSHQLQQPLRTIKNFVQIFEEDYRGLFDDNAIRHLKTITDSTDRMNLLILALSDYSRLGYNKILKAVDFNKIVYDVIADLNDNIKSSDAIIEVAEMPILNAYEIEIRQVFQNLIINAIKFQKKDARPEIKVLSRKLNDKWQFSVSDNGIGIAPAQHEKLFNMFQRLHTNENEYEGKGIGLAFCKKLIELHQGEIWVESNNGPGVTFYFTVPNLTL
jgi:PAS domain S-box-containing protein